MKMNISVIMEKYFTKHVNEGGHVCRLLYSGISTSVVNYVLVIGILNFRQEKVNLERSL